MGPQKHIGQGDLWMVPGFGRQMSTELDRRLRAPQDACITHLAILVPRGAAVDQPDVSARADTRADTAGDAFLPGCETGISPLEPEHREWMHELPEHGCCPVTDLQFVVLS